MYCSHCGSSLSETAKFCGSCGTPVQVTPAGQAEDTAQMQPSVQEQPVPQPEAPEQETVLQETVVIATSNTESDASGDASAVEPATEPIPQMPKPATPPAADPPSVAAMPDAGMPGQPGQSPQLFANLKQPAVARSIGVSLGIGIGAAVALALITALFFTMAASSSLQLEMLGDIPYAESLLNGNSFLTLAIYLLALGMGGSANFSASSLLTSSMGASVSLPVSLIGVALVVGAAFGAYRVARTTAIAYRWTGLACSALVGLASAAVVFALGLLFSTSGSVDVLGTSAASISLSSATFGTFFMTFLLGTLGASAGYALAQYAYDAPHVFAACWRWAHRTRGWVRTVVDAAWIYTLWFGALLVVLLILAVLGNSESASALLTLPVLLPALLYYLIAFVSFGSVGAMGQSFSFATVNNLAAMDESMATLRNVMVVFLIIFVIATVYIGMRTAARNMYDPAYKGWQHSWKAPVAMLVIWLAATYLFLPVRAVGQTIGLSPTYALIAAIWMFGAEAVALTFGEQAVRAMTSLWKIFVGATVRPTPETVTAHRIACGGPQRKAAAAATMGTAAGVSVSGSPSAAPAAPGTSAAASAVYSQTAASAAPITQPTAAPATAPVFPAESAPAATKPMSAKQKRNIIIGCSIGAAIVALLITVSTLNATVFSPKSAAQEYLQALESGNYDQAQSIVSPQLTKDQSALLTSKAAHETARISNVHITGTQNAGASKTVSFTYSLNGSSHDGSVTLVNEGRKFGVFNNWEITQPLTHEITMSVPPIVSSIKVNGVPVSQENAFRSSDDTWTFKVYPGAYEITADDSDYYSAAPVTIYTAEQESASVLKVTPSSHLEDEINTQLANYLDTCAKSTDSEPQGCPFSYYTWSSSNYRNFSWKISQYPKVENFNLSSGYFSASKGIADVTYEYRYSYSSKWEPDDSSSTFYLIGTFELEGDELKITELNY